MGVFDNLRGEREKGQMGGSLEEALEAPLGAGMGVAVAGGHIDTCSLIGCLVVHGYTFKFRPSVHPFFWSFSKSSCLLYYN